MSRLIEQPLVARADRQRLGQILVNFVSNAAWAAAQLPSPRVRVHVYRHGDTIIVSVRDNGPGMAPEIRDRIFEPFFTTRRGRGGTGLGLALCREYAEQMRARLHALDRGRARLLLPRSPARWVIGALTPRKAPHDKAPRRLAASSCAPSWVSRKPASQPARSAAGWPALARSGTSRHIP